MAQLGARLDGIEEVVGSNPIGSTNLDFCSYSRKASLDQCRTGSGASLCRRLSIPPCRMLSRTPADPLESLKTLHVLAIPEKNGKTQYEVDAQNPEQTITCVHSFFPHSGYSPCWYVKPRINQPIPM